MRIEVKTIKNISNHDFTDDIDLPQLKWDGEVYQLNAGESQSYEARLAEHFADKIVDRVILDNPEQGFPFLNRAEIRNPLLKKIFIEESEKKATMPELRKRATQLGLSWSPTDTQAYLEALIAENE